MQGLGNKPSTYRLVSCYGCGKLVQPMSRFSYQTCDDCATLQMYSDIYKSDNGFRPRLDGVTPAEAQQWLDQRKA